MRVYVVINFEWMDFDDPCEIFLSFEKLKNFLTEQYEGYPEIEAMLLYEVFNFEELENFLISQGNEYRIYEKELI